jgi:dTDP-4-dehydrorhamnose reductase
MRTVSIVGATGFIGSRIFELLRERAGDRLAVTGTSLRAPREPDVSALDMTDPAALSRHLERGFDFVVVAAGTKDVKRCELDPAHALALNTAPVRAMIRMVEGRGLSTRILYLSTDYVFDGERGLYRDDDTPRPRTHYGRSKQLAEQALLDSGGCHKVIRAGAVLGRGAPFFDWLLGELASSREVRLFEDCFNSPTPMELLCDMVLEILTAFDDVSEQVLHVVGERRMSRFETGRVVAAMLPGRSATLVPELRASGGELFQRDLSLVPSRLVRARQRRSFEEYLRRELGRGVAEVPAGGRGFRRR